MFNITPREVLGSGQPSRSRIWIDNLEAQSWKTITRHLGSAPMLIKKTLRVVYRSLAKRYHPDNTQTGMVRDFFAFAKLGWNSPILIADRDSTVTTGAQPCTGSPGSRRMHPWTSKRRMST